MIYVAIGLLAAGAGYWVWRRRRNKLTLRIAFLINNKQVFMDSTTLSNKQYVVATMVVTDRTGSNAPYDTGTAVMSSSDETIFTVAQWGDDPLGFRIIGVAPGTGTLTYDVKVNGTGLGPKTATVTVTQELAVNIDVLFSAPNDYSGI